MTTIARLKALSICPCGDTVLCESIGIGTEYSIHLDTVTCGFTYRCGACGATQYNVSCVLVDDRYDKTLPPMPMPIALFDLGEVN